MVVQAPSILTVRLPAELVAGSEFVVSCTLDPELGADGSVQPRLAITAPDAISALTPGVPILNAVATAHARVTGSLAEASPAFPPAASYPRIVPVDEVVTLQLLHRDDEPLRRLMLDDAQAARLDRLWDELRFVSQDAMTLRRRLRRSSWSTRRRTPTRRSSNPSASRSTTARRRSAGASSTPSREQLDAAIAFAEKAYRRRC